MQREIGDVSYLANTLSSIPHRFICSPNPVKWRYHSLIEAQIELSKMAIEKVTLDGFILDRLYSFKGIGSNENFQLMTSFSKL